EKDSEESPSVETWPVCGPGDLRMTNSFAFLTGNCRSRIWFIKEKIAVFAPMPKARVITAMAVKPGLFPSMRKPKVMSFQKFCIKRSPERQSGTGTDLMTRKA